MSLDLGPKNALREAFPLAAAADEMRDWFPLFGARVQVRRTDIKGTIWGISPRGVMLFRPGFAILTVALEDCTLEDGD